VVGRAHARTDHRAFPQARRSKLCVASADPLAVLTLGLRQVSRRRGACLGTERHCWTASRIAAPTKDVEPIAKIGHFAQAHLGIGDARPVIPAARSCLRRARRRILARCRLPRLRPGFRRCDRQRRRPRPHRPHPPSRVGLRLRPWLCHPTRWAPLQRRQLLHSVLRHPMQRRRLRHPTRDSSELRRRTTRTSTPTRATRRRSPLSSCHPWLMATVETSGVPVSASEPALAESNTNQYLMSMSASGL